MTDVIGHYALSRLRERGWKELRATIVNASVGTGTSTVAGFGPSGTAGRQRHFAVDGIVGVDFEIPRDITPSTSGYFHMHWTTNGTSTGLVKWELIYAVAEGYGVGTFPSSTTVTMEEAAAGVAWRHMTTECSTAIDFGGPGSFVSVRIRRATPTSGSNADQVYALSLGIEYQSELVDSTKNRVPNFYSG